MRRVRLEVETVENDLTLAAEDPRLPLGDDLTAFQSYSTDQRASTLVSALHRLEMSTWAIRRYHEALRDTRRVP